MSCEASLHTAIRAMHTTFVNHPISRGNTATWFERNHPNAYLWDTAVAHRSTELISFHQAEFKTINDLCDRNVDEQLRYLLWIRKFWGFHFGVVEASCLLRYGASPMGNQFRTLRKNVSGSYTAIIFKSIQFRELCTPDRIPSDAVSSPTRMESSLGHIIAHKSDMNERIM